MEVLVLRHLWSRGLSRTVNVGGGGDCSWEIVSSVDGEAGAGGVLNKNSMQFTLILLRVLAYGSWFLASQTASGSKMGPVLACAV